jgi:hypothetical protein
VTVTVTVTMTVTPLRHIMVYKCSMPPAAQLDKSFAVTMTINVTMTLNVTLVIAASYINFSVFVKAAAPP